MPRRPSNDRLERRFRAGGCAYQLVFTLVWFATSVCLAQPGSSEPLTVTGFLLHEHGGPAAEVEVVLRPYPSDYELQLHLLGEATALPAAVDRIRSGADGTFALSASLAGPYRLELTPAPVADEPEATLPPVHYALLPLAAPVALKPIVLPDRHRLTVTVLDQEGLQLNGALVVALPRGEHTAPTDDRASDAQPQRLYTTSARAAARTDMDGLARFLMPTREASVIVSAPGFALGQGRTESGHAAFRLEAQPGIALYVFDPAGELAPRAVVRAGHDRRTPLALTDDAGKATLGIATDRPTIFDFETPDRAVGQSPPIQPGSALDSAEGRVVAIRLVSADRIRGRVVDATSGLAVPEAAVWANRAPGRWARSDRYGTFDVDVWPGTDQENLLIAAAGYASDWATVSGPTVDLSISLTPAAPLFGLIKDGSDQPVAGAGIRAEPQGAGSIALRRSLREQRATSGADGSFRVPDALYGSPYRITVRAQGFANTAIDVPPLTRGAFADPVRIVLTRGRQTRGKVVDTEGNPVAGAAVKLRWPPESDRVLLFDRLDATKPTTTDERGEFRFPAVSAGQYELRAVHDEYLAPGNARAEVPAGEGDFDLGAFTLIPGAEIHGLVTGPNGEEVAGATVEVSRYGPDRDQERTTTTDPDGAFRLGGLPHEPVDLDVRADGYAPLGLQQARPETGEPILIELQAGASVAGRVVDAAGNAVARARVQVVPDWETRMRAGVWSSRDYFKRTGSDGRFHFEHLNSGTWSLEATEGTSNAKLSDIELAPGTEHEVELQLRSQDQLTVIVTTYLGEPVSEAEIRVQLEEDPLSGAYGTTDASGRAQIGVTAGAATVSIAHAEQPDESRDVVLDPGNNELPIQLRSGGAISGTVRSADGAPVALATVEAHSDDEVDRPVFLRRYSDRPPQTVSDHNGQFRITGLEPGAYFLTASATRFAESGPDHPIEIDGQAVNGVEILLAPGGSISGVVLGLRSTELSQVEISAFQNAQGHATKPDAEGNFALENLGPGTWNIVASTGELFVGRSVERTVTLGRGGTEAFVELPFERGLRLSGQVLVAGKPMTGGFLGTIPADDEAFRWTRTDHRGAFEIEGLEAGSYQLRIEQPFGGSEHRSIDLQTDLEGLRIDLQPPGSLTGVILDAVTGKPLANAWLVAGNAAQIAAFRAEDAGRLGTAGQTDSRGGGRFEIRFGPDAAQLWITRDGYQGALLPLNIAPGQHHQGLVIELRPVAAEAPNP